MLVRALLFIILAQLCFMCVELQAFTSHYDALEKVTEYIFLTCTIVKKK